MFTIILFPINTLKSIFFKEKIILASIQISKSKIFFSTNTHFYTKKAIDGWNDKDEFRDILSNNKRICFIFVDSPLSALIALTELIDERFRSIINRLIIICRHCRYCGKRHRYLRYWICDKRWLRNGMK